MPSSLFASLRIRLMLLVLLALLPVFALAFVDRYDQRQQNARAVQNHALELTQRAASEQRELIGAAHQLLLPLTQLAVVRGEGPIPCDIFFAEVLKENRLYVNLGMLDAHGSVVCAGAPSDTPINLGERPYFARVLRQQVIFGESEIGAIAITPTINIAYPIVDDAQQTQGAVFASLDLAWFRRFADAEKMVDGSTLVLVDRAAILGMRYPEMTPLDARALATSRVAQWFDAQDTQRVVEYADPDDVTRLYAFVPLSPTGYMGIGIPSALAYDQVDRRATRELARLLLVTGAALLIAWAFSDRFIARQLRVLLHTTRRLTGGDLGARTGELSDASELGQLARAFDQMAATLQQRDTEQKYSTETLRQQTEELATITRLSREVTSVLDLNQVLASIARATAQLSQSDASGVYIPDAQGILRLAVGYGVSAKYVEAINAMGVKPGEGAIGRAEVERRPVQLHDMSVEYEYRFAPIVRAEGLRAVLAVPMFRDEHIVGGIVLWHRQPRHFTVSEVVFLQAIAQQCVNAVENARLMQAEREARELAEALRDTAAALSGTLDFDELLDRILDNVGRVVPHDSANIMLIEQGVALLVRERFRTPQAGRVLNERIVIADAANLREMVETKQARVVEDTRHAPKWVDFPETRWIGSHLGAPICVKGQVIGFLNLDSATSGFFRAAHIPRLQAFADQAALALENARLLAETEKRASHFAALRETAQVISAQQDLPTLLETVIERAMLLLGASHGGLYLYDPTRRDLELVVQKGSAVTAHVRLPLGKGMAGRVAQTRQPLIVDDYGRWEHRAPQFAEVDFSAVLQVPLLLRGELIGVLSVAEVGATTRQFSNEDARLLSLFASQVAGAVHNARLLQQTHTRAEQMTLVYDAGLALNSILEPRAQLEYLLKIALRALKADSGVFFRYDAAHNAIQLEVCLGYAAETQMAVQGLNTMVGDEHSVIGWVATNRVPLNLPEVSADPRYTMIDPQLRAGLWMPVEREQQLLGVIGVLSTRPDAFLAEDERLLALFANQAAVALENARLFDELQTSLRMLTRLYELSSQLLTAGTVAEVTKLAAQTLRDSFAADSSWLHLFDAQGNLEYSDGLGWNPSLGDITPRPNGLSVKVWQSGKPIIVHDQQAMHPAARTFGVQSEVVLPLRGEPINLGVLFLNYRSPHPFSEREIELLSLFANQVALAIKRVRLTTETQQRMNQLAVLNRIANAVNQTLGLDELLHVIYREIAATLPCDAFFIALYDPMTEELDFRIQIDEDLRLPPERRPLKAGLSWRVINERKPLLIRNRETDLQLPAAPETLWGTLKPAQSWIGVPIQIGDAVVGIISVQSYKSNVYDESDAQLLATIADQVAVAIQQARLFEETRQRLAELEAVNEISKALRVVQTSAEMLPLLLDAALEVIRADCGAAGLFKPDSDVPDETVARGWLAEIAQEQIYSQQGIAGRVLMTGEPHICAEFRSDSSVSPDLLSKIPPDWGGICLPIRTTREIIGVLFVAIKSPRVVQPNEAQILTTIAEIAGNAMHRAALHEQTEQRLRRLNALHTIDTAINASLDLRVTLHILLTQIGSQLQVDAADVLLLDTTTQALAYTAGHGFRSSALARISLPLGEGYPSRAARERQIVHLAALASNGDDPRAALLGEEGFVAYFAAPLVSKGQFKGVLELFHRAPLEPTADWLAFLGTLAGQTVLAVENAVLFTSLQRSNVELALAYESTIEGWSRALDLRDHETEGHTQRVAEMTCRLARILGISDAELVNIRRGALLHDIGKIAISDHTLLKKTRLSQAEAERLRLHPQYAYELLSPIEYLRSALDIPYYHHEKWDGSGYPRGLKGEEIPLAARIFAIVDVWDALRSERPYRRAWRDAEVKKYLEAQANAHFDPQILRVFLRLLEE